MIILKNNGDYSVYRIINQTDDSILLGEVSDSGYAILLNRDDLHRMEVSLEEFTREVSKMERACLETREALFENGSEVFLYDKTKSVEDNPTYKGTYLGYDAVCNKHIVNAISLEKRIFPSKEYFIKRVPNGVEKLEIIDREELLSRYKTELDTLYAQRTIKNDVQNNVAEFTKQTKHHVYAPDSIWTIHNLLSEHKALCQYKFTNMADQKRCIVKGIKRLAKPIYPLLIQSGVDMESLKKCSNDTSTIPDSFVESYEQFYRYARGTYITYGSMTHHMEVLGDPVDYRIKTLESLIDKYEDKEEENERE